MTRLNIHLGCRSTKPGTLKTTKVHRLSADSEEVFIWADGLYEGGAIWKSIVYESPIVRVEVEVFDGTWVPQEPSQVFPFIFCHISEQDFRALLQKVHERGVHAGRESTKRELRGFLGVD